MLLGIPRGFFYYDYISFAEKLFDGSRVRIVTGPENDREILAAGGKVTVDEACLPVKLFAGQVEKLCGICDKVFIPRVMRDNNGGWLCPKLLGIPELTSRISREEKLLVTDPIYFDSRPRARRTLWSACRQTGMDRKLFQRNFENAYSSQMKVASGMERAHVEAAWEFTPEIPKAGEIILPNVKKVLVLGHCYNLYDRFANCNIMKKLDDMAIEAVTGRDVTQSRREAAVKKMSFAKKPFWEAFVRIIGTALVLKDEVGGIIYLSSFSCGIDSLLFEVLKSHVGDKPVMMLKLDEHRGEAGLETRIEAFADLLDRRSA